jgi:hypothetical protein
MQKKTYCATFSGVLKSVGGEYTSKIRYIEAISLNAAYEAIESEYYVRCLHVAPAWNGSRGEM